MKSERLSDRSTPSTAERRPSDHGMLIDPPHTAGSEERPASTGLIGDHVPPHSQHSFMSEPPSRPSFAHSLSFDSASPATSLANVPYKHAYIPPPPGLPTYSKTFGHGSEPSHSQGEMVDRPDSHSIHSHRDSSIAADSQNNIAEFNSLTGQPTSFANSTSSIHSFVQPPEQMGHSQPGYDSNFYVPPSQATVFHYESGPLAWSVDNPFDQGLLAIPFSSFDGISNQWTENLENMVAEGLEVNIDRDSTSTPSNDDDSESAQLSQYEKMVPTSYPTGSTQIVAPTPRRPDDGKDEGIQQEYTPHENWTQHDMRGAVENMDFLKTTTILLQESARKLRATAQPCRYGNLLSGIKLTEEKRDDIKSMLDDTNAHSRLNFPSEKDASRLPRLEIFNILIKSYFHNFHPQHPILHLQSLLPRNGNCGLEKKKDILIYAMCCAGAFKHAARPIQDYARGMQELLRRTFNFHFDKDPRNLRCLQSMQALHLALYVGGWSGNAWASERSQALCGTLATMLRCSSWLDGEHGEWLEEELKEVAPGKEEERWRAFVEREEKKRLIIAQFSIECHLGAFTRSRSSMMWSELTMPSLCELDLWRAETADEWAKLWNQNLRCRLPRGDENLHNASVTSLLQHFAKMSEDINTVVDYAKRPECVRHLPIILVGIHSMVAALADNRSCVPWESRAMNIAMMEARAMLDYWWAAREASLDSTTDWLEFSTVDITPQERALNDTYVLLFHLTALMLHIPLREVRLMKEGNAELRKAAKNRLWRTWKDNNGEDARVGLWHAGQIIKQARIMSSHDTGPAWLAPMVAEAANVMWSYAALIDHDNQLQRGNLFNKEFFRIDSDDKWENIPLSTRSHGVPSICNRKGDFITLFHPHDVVTVCAEILNRGPLKKTRHSRSRTILDEQFTAQLDQLVRFGKVKVFATGMR